MIVSSNHKSDIGTEQNLNNKEFEISPFVIESIKNLIIEDKFNLFKIKSKEAIDDELQKTESDISKFLEMKNKGLEKEKELEKRFLFLQKDNLKFETDLKKKLNI
jgi:hypothetical protein